MARIKDAAAIAKITIGFLFASAFQVPMVYVTDFYDLLFEAEASVQIIQFCIYNLCKHPEYYDRLKAEGTEYKDTSFGSLNKEMPYLDSFVKETARLSPGPIRELSLLSHELKKTEEEFLIYVLIRSRPLKSALLEQSWSHIPPLTAIRYRLATGSPYHSLCLCEMRVFGRGP